MSAATLTRDVRLCVSVEAGIRIVSELCQIPPETPVKHGDLRGHSDAHRCCGKSLVETALLRFDVRQHARAQSISKRAPSTTRTSLRFRIKGLRTVGISMAQNPASRISDLACRMQPNGYEDRRHVFDVTLCQTS